jgi:hypothetical protein
MLITVGFWRTRNDQKAFVATVTANPLRATDPFCCLGWIADQAISWDKRGCFNADGSHHEYDLLEVWIDKSEGPKLVNVVKVRNDKKDSFFAWEHDGVTRLGAEAIVVACTQIELKDGDGLTQYLPQIQVIK